MRELQIRCLSCGRLRPFEQFILGICISCAESTDVLYNFTPQDLTHLRIRAYRYKLSPEQFLDMVESRAGACDICSEVKGLRLCIDHCHNSNTVRGLLCHSCNTQLGRIENGQSPPTKAFKRYLDKFF